MKLNKFFLSFFILVLFGSLYSQSFNNISSEGDLIKNAVGMSKFSQFGTSGIPTTNNLTASVNEEEYIVDAGDIFIIKIDQKGPAHKVFNALVTSDGFVVIPDAPSVYVKDLVLKNAKNKIQHKLKQHFPDSIVECFLYQLHPISVSVLGAVPQEATINLLSNNRLFDAVSAILGNVPVDTNKIFDFRTISFRDIKIFRDKNNVSYDLLKFIVKANNDQNPYLMNEDIVYIGYKDSTRYSVSVYGAVARPINFEYKQGDTIVDALKFAGGLLPSADSTRMELHRFINRSSDVRRSIIKFPDDTSIALLPDDRIFARYKYNYHEKYYVQILGAVKFPGNYAINDGITKLSEIIADAGGFSDKASLKNAKLLRSKDLFEDKELNRLRRMTAEEMNDIELSYLRLRSREDIRLISTDFERLFKHNIVEEDVVLRDKDVIIIPEKRNTVLVSGGIISPGNVLYEADRNYIDYIELAGGFNERAREGKVKIIKTKTGVWLDASEDINIEEGDVVFIPEREEIDWYELFTETLTISTQLATIALIVYNLQN